MKTKLHVLLSLWLAILLTLNIPSPAPAQDALEPKLVEEKLQEISARLSAVNNLKAVFVQERHLAILIEPLISKGRCFFNRPQQLRWEIVQPYHSLLIYNNKRMAKFDVRDGQLRKLQPGGEDMMREILGQIIAWMQGDFESAAAVYHLQMYREKTLHLVLRPRSKELAENIQAIELIFSEAQDYIQTVKIIESQMDFIRIDFRQVEHNTEIPERIFDLSNPLLIKETDE